MALMSPFQLLGHTRVHVRDLTALYQAMASSLQCRGKPTACKFRNILKQVVDSATLFKKRRADEGSALLDNLYRPVTGPVMEISQRNSKALAPPGHLPTRSSISCMT
eukprot:scaffold488723_cov33-Prasinocladus_malaysianus.AAC.2